MKAVEKCLTVITIIFVLWVLVSWVDVINHNNPVDQDGMPADWNTFVLLTNVLE